MATSAYVDQAVFMPERGAVLIAPVGTAAPDNAAVQSWIAAGATDKLGDFVPIGYTSLDDLPKLDQDTDGGEKMGAWENDALRISKVTIDQSWTVTPIQWTETALSHYFGKGTVDGATGAFAVPASYTSSEVAILVVVISGSDFLAFHTAKAATQPGDAIEFDPEKFAGMPIKYTILAITGQPKMTIFSDTLVTAGE